MKLVFRKSRNGEGFVSNINGIVVLMRDGSEGEHDIMFTGVAKSGKALFAKIITDQVKRVQSKGFSRVGHMCCDSADFVEYVQWAEKEVWTEFTPGLLHQHLYISSNNFNRIAPVLEGTFYITLYKGDWKCAGVEDYTLFREFVTKNKQFLEFFEKKRFHVGDIIQTDYWGHLFIYKIISMNEEFPYDNIVIEAIRKQLSNNDQEPNWTTMNIGDGHGYKKVTCDSKEVVLSNGKRVLLEIKHEQELYSTAKIQAAFPELDIVSVPYYENKSYERIWTKAEGVVS